MTAATPGTISMPFPSEIRSRLEAVCQGAGLNFGLCVTPAEFSEADGGSFTLTVEALDAAAVAHAARVLQDFDETEREIEAQLENSGPPYHRGKFSFLALCERGRALDETLTGLRYAHWKATDGWGRSAQRRNVARVLAHLGGCDGPASVRHLMRVLAGTRRGIASALDELEAAGAIALAGRRWMRTPEASAIKAARIHVA